MQRFAVYLKTVQRRGYPPLPHIMVDSEPPVSVLTAKSDKKALVFFYRLKRT
jgi:hypothetical protein